jgi:phosphate transport system protein
MAVTKTITDLERIGDEVERIGRVTLRMMSAYNETPRGYFTGVITLADYVRNMLHSALDAFARMDVQAALTIAKDQANVEEQYRATLRSLITYMMEDPRSISRVLDVIWTVRALERIGAHTSNICEYIIYFVVGKDVRHIRLEDIEHELHPGPPNGAP